jgi:hypothetical protein
MGTEGACLVLRQVNPRGAKKHHDAIRDMMATSSHDFRITNLDSQPVFQYGWKMPHFHNDCLAGTKVD